MSTVEQIDEVATLSVSGLHAGYSTMEAVTGVDLEVTPGRTTSLVGRNGAGKTTCLLAVAGIRYGSNRGTVRLGEVNLSSAGPAAIVEAGLAHVPEGHRIFRTLTVRENLQIGAWVHRRVGRDAAEESMRRVFDLFPILLEYESRIAGLLSGGQQQMLAIGQALMSNPKILMLDEPTSGLALPVIKTILEALANLRDAGMGILLVDQSIQRALDNSTYTYVMEQGKIAISGPSAELAE